jgi:hypothetical protein
MDAQVIPPFDHEELSQMGQIRKSFFAIVKTQSPDFVNFIKSAPVNNDCNKLFARVLLTLATTKYAGSALHKSENLFKCISGFVAHWPEIIDRRIDYPTLARHS